MEEKKKEETAPQKAEQDDQPTEEAKQTTEEKPSTDGSDLVAKLKDQQKQLDKMKSDIDKREIALNARERQIEISGKSRMQPEVTAAEKKEAEIQAGADEIMNAVGRGNVKKNIVAP